MADLPWNKPRKCARKEQGRKVLTHLTASNQTQSQKDRGMTADKQYGDSADNFNSFVVAGAVQ